MSLKIQCNIYFYSINFKLTGKKSLLFYTDAKIKDWILKKTFHILKRTISSSILKASKLWMKWRKNKKEKEKKKGGKSFKRYINHWKE